MGTQTTNVAIPYEQLRVVCERYHVRKLALFGSVLRPDFRVESDIDVLVEYEPGTPVSLFDMVDLQLELEALFGRKIDLGTPSSLSKYIRKIVLGSAQAVYEHTRWPAPIAPHA